MRCRCADIAFIVSTYTSSLASSSVARIGLGLSGPRLRHCRAPPALVILAYIASIPSFVRSAAHSETRSTFVHPNSVPAAIATHEASNPFVFCGRLGKTVSASRRTVAARLITRLTRTPVLHSGSLLTGPRADRRFAGATKKFWARGEPVRQGPVAWPARPSTSLQEKFWIISAIWRLHFYFLQQLVHSLSRFLSIFSKLVERPHHCGKNLKPCTLPKRSSSFATSASLLAERACRLAPATFPLAAEPSPQQLLFELRSPVGRARRYLQDAHAQCPCTATSSTLPPRDDLLREACTRLHGLVPWPNVRANLQPWCA